MKRAHFSFCVGALFAAAAFVSGYLEIQTSVKVRDSFPWPVTLLIGLTISVTVGVALLLSCWADGWALEKRKEEKAAQNKNDHFFFDAQLFARGVERCVNSTAGGTASSAARAQKEFETLRYILDALNTRINNEYTMIGARTGWLITGTAFLVTAFVTLLNNETLSEVEKFTVLLGVAGVGLAGACGLAIGIFFGHACYKALKEVRAKVEITAFEKFGIPKMGVPVGFRAHRWGHHATRLIPSFSIAIWVTLIVMLIFDVNHPLYKKPGATDVRVTRALNSPAIDVHAHLNLAPSANPNN
jgi:hypothetical protein